MNTTPNLFDSLERIILALLGKSRGGAYMSGDPVVISLRKSGLNFITSPQFTNLDKTQFYLQLKKYFPSTYKTIYRLMALETRYFESGQFERTGSAGMRAFGTEYPYGWSSAKELWKEQAFRPVGFAKFIVNNKPFYYLAFKSPLAFAAYLDLYIKKYGAGRWYSSDPTKQQSYLAALSKIKLPVS